MADEALQNDNNPIIKVKHFDEQDERVSPATEVTQSGIRFVLESTDFATEGTLSDMATDLESLEDKVATEETLMTLSGIMVNGTQLVQITDGEETALVTPDGRLKVETSQPEAPPSTTAVEDEEVGTISSGNYQNYDIPLGETLTIQRFFAGCEGEGGKGAKVILYYDQGGGEPIQNQEIARLYVQSSSEHIDLNWVAPRPAEAGDRIRIWRYPSEGSTQEVYGKWKGYY